MKITNAGIEIGAPNSSRIIINPTSMELWGQGTVQLRARETVQIVNGPDYNVGNLSTTGLELRSGGTVQVGRKGPA